MIKKLKFIIFFSILIILALCTQSQARITTSDPTVESGGTATITINSQEPVAYGAIDVTSDGGLTFVSVSGGVANGTNVAFSSAENKTSGIVTYKFKVPTVTKTTTYKVQFTSADMGTPDGEVPSSSATATVTVKAKSTNTGSENSGSNNSGGNNSGSGSQSGGNNTTSTPSVSFTSTNKTMYATTSLNVRSSYSTSSSVIGSLDAGDKVTQTGIATRAVSGITWSRINYNGSTAYVSSQYLTSEEPEEEKSSNNNLKSLTVGAYELTPEFSADVTEYSLTVDENVDVLQVTAEPEDETADVEVSGNDGLLLGENTIEIKVTAEDETVKTYTINVTKGEAPKIQLEELSVEGYTLSPEFKGNVYSYTLTINDVNVKNLTINAKSDNEAATIEILGNEEFKLGENIVTILVKSADEEEVTTYQIVVNIEEEVQEVVAQIIPGIDDNDLFLYGGIGLGALLLIIIIAIIVSKRRNKDDEFDTFDAGFAPIDDKKEESKENLSNDNINDEKEEKRSRRKTKKDLIDESFGDNVDNSISDDDRPKRKSGKHF